MKKLLFALFLTVLLVLSACSGGGDEEGSGSNDQSEQTSQDDSSQGTDDSSGSGDQASSDVDAKAAKEAFEQNGCISCHGNDLGGGYGPSLQKVGAKYSADDIQNIIKNGKNGMPPQSVGDSDRELIASWLAAKK